MTDDIEVLKQKALRFYYANRQPLRLTRALGQEIDPDQPKTVDRSKRRQRRPTLAVALRQADKAGVNVVGATIRRDGSVALAFGSVSGRPESPDNEWDTVQ
jgi:hypothetical protein